MAASMIKTGSVAWLLTPIAFCIGLIEIGTFKSFGVFLLPVRESLDCSLTALGTAMSASHTLCFLVGPMVNLMTLKYGPRWIIITGGVILYLSFLAAAFARDIITFSICLLISGIGSSMAIISSIASLVMYCSNAPLLYAISAAGGAFGMMIYPPVVDLLVSVYGWRWAMMIVAAVKGNIWVFGGLIKLPRPTYETLASTDASDSDEMNALYQQNHQRDQNIFWYWCKKVWYWCKKAARKFCVIMSLNVIGEEPSFTVYCFAHLITGLVYASWIIYLVSHAVVRGIESDLASLLSTAGGVNALIGRILYGPILHLEYISAVQMYILLSVTNCVAFLLDPVVLSKYLGLVCLASVNGLCTGVLGCLQVHLSLENLDSSLQNQGWCTLTLFFAIGEIVGGALTGFVVGTSEIQGLVFVFLGGISAVTPVIILIERLLNHCVK